MLGEAGEDYRQAVYETRLRGPRRSLRIKQVVGFLKTANSWIEHSLKANRREDGLFHSYNLLRRSSKSIGIEHLYEMLEGQVSILSSQSLSPETAVQLLDGLRRSKIFRPDKGSYMLYPDRELPAISGQESSSGKGIPEIPSHSEVVEIRRRAGLLPGYPGKRSI